MDKNDIVNALQAIEEITVHNVKITNIVVDNNNIKCVLEIPKRAVHLATLIRDKCNKALKKISNGIVTITLTNQVRQKHRVANIKKILLITSGKGGVGKSTVALNLAIALNHLKQRVALIDADIYGPSIPHLIGNKNRPTINSDNYILPLKQHGIEFISIGNIIPEEKATVWRGPMLSKALLQLFLSTHWQPADYMIVDMPPGTGDIQISLAVDFIVNGVIIVSTPQKLALIEAQKTYDMFTKANVAIIGIIENMSYLRNTDDTVIYPFGKDGGKNLANKLHTHFLGSIPLDPMICAYSDASDPAVLHKSFYYHEIARQVLLRT